MSSRVSTWGVVLALALAASPAWAIVVSGTIADAGWGGDYTRWTSETFTPNTTPVLIEGSLELTNLTQNGAIMVGLLDKQYVDDGNSGYMGGAYAYIANIGNTKFRIGPSDGNLGGEIVQTYVEVPRDPAGPNLLDFSMIIHAGSIELKVFADTVMDTYGEIKDMNSTTAYSWDEFEFGAYLGADLWSPNGSVAYSLTATQEGEDVIPEPVTAMTFGAALAGLAAWSRRRRAA